MSSVTRCTFVREGARVRLAQHEGVIHDRSLCHLLVDLEMALRTFGYVLVYFAFGVERAYRKDDVLVVLDYTSCLVETNASCEQLNQLYERYERMKSQRLYI